MFSKKRVPYFATIKEIDKLLESGETRDDIYDKLVEQYGSEKGVARIIKATPDPELKKKFGWLNNLLLLCLVIVSLLKIISAPIILFPILPPLIALIITIFVIYLVVIINIGVKMFRGDFYGVILYLGLWSLFKLFSETGQMDIYYGIDITLLLLIIILSYSLKRFLFYKVNLFSLKKDKNGRYILE